MKVSDAIDNFNKTTITGSDKYNTKLLLEMLDKNFIDRKELKAKINKKIDYLNTHHSEIKNYQRCILELESILKLLEE